MCKLAGVCLVMGGSLLFGINNAVKIRKRRDDLRTLERIVMYLESEIRYRHSVMSEAFGSAAQKTDKPFSDWLLELEIMLKDNINNSDAYPYYEDEAYDEMNFSCDTDYKSCDFYRIWCESLVRLQDDTFLNDSDMEELKSLGQTLGYMDIEAHRAGIELFLLNIHNRINDINCGLKDRIRISVVAGAVFGILVVMVLV